MSNILVIGESCLDIFHYGVCERLTPEGPVPVFKSTRTSCSGGMAMNVYNNLKVLTDKIDIHTNTDWKNIKKTRFVEEKSNHMFIRLDENDDEYGKADIQNINFSNYEAIIVSDYNKGFLTEEDLTQISESHEKTFLDTKKTLGDWCKKFTFIKINGPEYDRTRHLLDEEIRKILIVTQGSEGCFHLNKKYDVPMVEVKDVSGAGDTFLAGFAYKFIKTNSLDLSINFGNICATKVVQKRGVSTI